MSKGFGNILNIQDVPLLSSRSKNEDKEHMVIDNKKYRIKDCYSETSEPQPEDDGTDPVRIKSDASVDLGRMLL